MGLKYKPSTIFSLQLPLSLVTSGMTYNTGRRYGAQR